jgi:hypothetical protein
LTSPKTQKINMFSMLEDVKGRSGNITESIGKFIIIWRQGSKQVVKILSVQESEVRVTYEIMNGPDKGKKFNSRYEPEQKIWMYDKDSDAYERCSWGQKQEVRNE